jgi:PAS domain S-box-containing protein
MLKRIKWVYFLSLIFAIVMAGALINDVVQINNIQQIQKKDNKVSLVWFLSQADKETRTFLQNVSYFYIEKSDLARENMKVSFDILWSRYDHDLNKQIAKMLQALPLGSEVIDSMRTTLELIEPLVYKLEPPNQDAFDQINQYMTEQINRSYFLAITAVQERQSIRSERLSRLNNLYNNLLITLLGLMIATLILIISFVAKSRELKTQNLIFEKRVKERTNELNKTNESLLFEAQIRQKADRKSQQLISAFNQSKEVVFFLDAQNRFIFFNESFININSMVKGSIAIGAPFEKYLQALMDKLYSSSQNQLKQNWISKWLQGLLNADDLFEVNFASDQEFIFNIDRLDDGSVISIGADITALKETQSALAESESRFRDFALIGADWYWEMDENLTFTFFSGAAEKISGFPPEFFLGQSRENYYGIRGAANQRSLAQYLSMTDRREAFHDFETKWKTGHNKLVTISLSGEPRYDQKGNFTGYIGAGRDVTERCLVEERDTRFLTAINSLNLSVTIYNEADILVFYNQQFESFCKEMGLSIELGISFEKLWQYTSNFFSEQFGFDAAQWFDERLSLHRNNVKNFVLPIGKDRYLNIFEQTLEDGGVIVISTDISESRKAEKEIERLRNYLSNIIDSISSVLIAVDTDNRVIQWNYAAELETGINFEQAFQKELKKIFPRLEPNLESINDAIKLGRESSQLKRMFIKNDNAYYEDVTIYPLKSGEEAGAVIRLDNVTEQVMISEMMIQSEKMLSLGGLAAGMAHEINNPLAGMMQTANVMRNRLVDTDIPANNQVALQVGTQLATINAYMQGRGILKMVDNIIESGQRVALIVENMLDFSRQNEAVSGEQNIATLLDKAVELSMTDHNLKHKYDFKNIEIVKQYQDDMPLINCEGGKIQQVFLNLLRNAAQAMQDAGINNPRIIFRISYDNEIQHVIIEVEDNGPGINEDIKSRVFDPFFTTKSEGLGTGLGLSVSYFIITENHAGKLSVDSMLGEYSKFTICLPRSGKYTA